VNRKARFDYFIEERFEAGISLMGWRSKSMRAGKAQIAEGLCLRQRTGRRPVRRPLEPLTSASTHVETDPTRTRKLLLNRPAARPFDRCRRAARLTPWCRCSCTGRPAGPSSRSALAKGKKQHDKRHSEKDRDWQRDKGRIMKAMRR